MWEINIGSQAQGFLCSLVLGGVICLVYDFIRTLRLTGKSGTLTVFFEDIIFWLICTFLVFCFLMGITGGQIRGYILFGAFLGFLIFRFTVSAVLMVILKKIFSVIRAVKKTLNGFFSKFVTMINQKMVIKGRKLRNNLKKTAKSLKKLLKKGRGLMYTKHE